MSEIKPLPRSAKSKRARPAKPRAEPPGGRAGAAPRPAPGKAADRETAPDRVVLEIRRFIAASIFFNARAAEQAGLGLTDMQLLHLLQLHGPSTPGHLASWSGLSSGGVTVALDRLSNAGYISREPNPADRRSLLVTLRPGRLKRLAAMYAGVEGETRRQLATLTQGDLEAVIRFFRALAAVRANTPTAAVSRSK
ncbi:MAG: MarR family winged helix-turn-helix transcriptional regulator [Steroidobacteraceae bacterium]